MNKTKKKHWRILIFLILSVCLASEVKAVSENGFKCEFLNYHDMVACDDPKDCAIKNEIETTGETGGETNYDSYKKFSENKIIVIVESPFFSERKDFAKTCARKTTCTISTTDNNKKCFSQYVDPKECIMVQNDNGQSVSCEYIQAFIAKNGPDLLYGFIGIIYVYFVTVGSLIAIFIMIVGGIIIASAGGSSERVNKAKTLIIRSLTGLIVLVLSAAILYSINPNFFTNQ